MSSDEHVLELLPGYALDCLDEDETIFVSEHLAVCADCRAELLAYQATVNQLALTGPDTTPPPGLKDRLMDRIQSAQSTPLSQPRPLWWQLPGIFMRRATPVWGVASLVLILALVIGNLWLWQRLNQIEAGQAPAEIMQTVALNGTDVVPDASGLLVISLDGQHGTLVVERLPTLDKTQQYQLWLIKDGQRDSGAVFSVNQDGYGSVWISSPKPFSDYSAFGITIEPAGGSPGPTGDKVLGGSL